MIKIPDEVVEAAAKEIAMTCRCEMACDWRGHLEDARAAIAAGLNAWPNAKTLRDDGRRQTYIVPALVLPLAQEARDD
jgi:hypothetical protein